MTGSEAVAKREAEDGARASERRDLTKAKELRALTHPVRLALLEVLHVEGSLTATEAGERIGESATTCSFHLRQLAKYGFVEEAGSGPGRRRPWQIVNREVSFSGIGDPEYSVAADELSSLLFNRWLGRYRQWQQVQHHEPEWAEVAGSSERVAYLTRDELAELHGQIASLFAPYKGRDVDASLRPAGSRLVETVMFAHPVVDLRAEEG